MGGFKFTEEERASAVQQEEAALISQDRPAFTHCIELGNYSDVHAGASGEATLALTLIAHPFEVPDRMILRRLIFQASSGGTDTVAAALYKITNWSTAGNFRSNDTNVATTSNEALKPALQLRFITTFGTHSIPGLNYVAISDLPQDVELTDAGGPYAIVFQASSTGAYWNNNQIQTFTGMMCYKMNEVPTVMGDFPQILTARLDAVTGGRGPYALLRSKIGIRLYPTKVELIGL